MPFARRSSSVPSLIGAATETIGYLTHNPRFERLSRLIAFTLIFTTAGVSFLGVTLVFVLNIFWPQFWSILFHIMFWPLLLEASFFLAEAVFAYALVLFLGLVERATRTKAMASCFRMGGCRLFSDRDAHDRHRRVVHADPASP